MSFETSSETIYNDELMIIIRELAVQLRAATSFSDIRRITKRLCELGDILEANV